MFLVVPVIFSFSFINIANEGENIKNMDFNFDDIKKMIDDSYVEKEKTKTIELNKK